MIYSYTVFLKIHESICSTLTSHHTLSKMVAMSIIINKMVPTSSFNYPIQPNYYNITKHFTSIIQVHLHKTIAKYIYRHQLCVSSERFHEFSWNINFPWLLAKMTKFFFPRQFHIPGILQRIAWLHKHYTDDKTEKAHFWQLSLQMHLNVVDTDFTKQQKSRILATVF